MSPASQSHSITVEQVEGCHDSYPARTCAYQPRPSDSYLVPASSAQDYSQPNRSYSYYDQDGIEHDSRYPHWSFHTRCARPSGGE